MSRRPFRHRMPPLTLQNRYAIAQAKLRIGTVNSGIAAPVGFVNSNHMRLDVAAIAHHLLSNFPIHERSKLEGGEHKKRAI